MDVRRLVAVLTAVQHDNNELDLAVNLRKLDSEYKQAIQSPGEATAEAFRNTRDAIEVAAKEGRVAALSATQTKLLSDLNGELFAGPGLIEDIDRILGEGQNPAEISTALTELKDAAGEFYKIADASLTQLKALGIELGEPDTDSAQLEIHLPAALFGGSLGGLSKETGRLNTALLTIVETLTGSRPELKITAVDSGSIEFYLMIDHISGAGILKVIGGIVLLMNGVVKMRRSQKELANDKAPADLLAAFEKWEKKRVDDELATMRDDLLKLSKEKDGRRNELKKGLMHALTYLADQIDRGMDVDVTAAPLPAPDDDDDGDGDPSGGALPITRKPPPPTPLDKARRELAESTGAIRALDRESEAVLMLTPGEVTGAPEPAPAKTKASE